MTRKILASLLAVALIACLGVTVASAPATSADVEKVSEAIVIAETNGVEVTSNSIVVDSGGGNAYELSGLWWNLSKYPNGVPYIVNPSTAVAKYGLKTNDVMAAIKASLETWDSAVAPELYNNSPTINNKAKASTSRPDYKNVITWGPLPSGTIAQSTTWYLSTTKEIVDADIVFNSNYKWGIDRDGEGTAYTLVGRFDIQNIATHEAGHWTGLNDLYDKGYANMTMYGYASYGEVIKISLERGDITGAQAVYKS